MPKQDGGGLLTLLHIAMPLMFFEIVENTVRVFGRERTANKQQISGVFPEVSYPDMCCEVPVLAPSQTEDLGLHPPCQH
jgi:hypothetical protein